MSVKVPMNSTDHYVTFNTGQPELVYFLPNGYVFAVTHEQNGRLPKDMNDKQRAIYRALLNLALARLDAEEAS